MLESNLCLKMYLCHLQNCTSASVLNTVLAFRCFIDLNNSEISFCFK